jgi:hypothetical protein
VSAYQRGDEQISPVPAVLTDPSVAAVCRDAPPEQQGLWVSGGARDQQQAARLCLDCPLLDPCRAYAVAQPWRQLFGVWGGTTYTDRRRMAGGRR